MSSILQQNAELLARMTLRQLSHEKGLENLAVEFVDLGKKFLGLAIPWENKIQISTRTLQSEILFEKVLRHEIAHIIDFAERGTFAGASGRNNFHGKSFKKVCRRIGADPRPHLNSIVFFG